MTNVSDYLVYGLQPVDAGGDDDNCPVCLEPLENTRALRSFLCSHTLCQSCTLQWYLKQGANTCPLCRTQMYSSLGGLITDEVPLALSMDEVIGNTEAIFYYWREQGVTDDAWFRPFARHRLLDRPWVQDALIPNASDQWPSWPNALNSIPWPVSTFGLIRIPEALPHTLPMADLAEIADAFITDHLNQARLNIDGRPARIFPSDASVAMVIVIGNLIPLVNNARYTRRVEGTPLDEWALAQEVMRDEAWERMMYRLAMWHARHANRLCPHALELPATIAYDIFSEMLDEVWSGGSLFPGESACLVAGSVENVDFLKAVQFMVWFSWVRAQDEWEPEVTKGKFEEMVVDGLVDRMAAVTVNSLLEGQSPDELLLHM